MPQSLLQAVGVGAKRSLPAAATINWVLKDGLGRLGRLTVATRFGESFDSDLKASRGGRAGGGWSAGRGPAGVSLNADAGARLCRELATVMKQGESRACRLR